MGSILSVRGQELPSPVSISVNDEIIWTSDTGRTLSGLMVGDVVAEKKNLSIKWGVLTETEMLLIKNSLSAGFYPVTFHDDGIELTMSSYRSTLTKEQIGYLSDGIFYYRSASVSIIER